MIVFVSQFLIFLGCNYLIFTEKTYTALIGYTLLEIYILYLLDSSYDVLLY
jgi:hypothetical protein